jgi:hypothetical protein
MIKVISPDNSTHLISVIALTKDVIAFVSDSICIEILKYTNNPNETTTKLTNKHHNKAIKTIKFSRQDDDKSDVLLCTCSIDSIIIWNVDKILSNNSNLECHVKVYKDLEYEPFQCCFDPSNERIAVCGGDTIKIIQIKVSFVDSFESILNLKI